MRKKTKRKLRITKRDRSLFLYLYENKIASGKQIKRDIFNNIHLTVVQRRLRRLKSHGFLKEMAFVRKTTPFKAWSITSKAFNTHVSHELEQIERRQLGSNSPFHDMDLVEIRHAFFGKERVKEYLTENVIQSGSSLHGDEIERLKEHFPDALVKMRIGKKDYWFCLEYEASLKSSSRCEEFLRKYYFHKNVAAVLFIYEEENIYKKILSLEKKLFSKMTPKIYYCSFEKIQSNKDQLEFENSKKTTLKIVQSDFSM